MAKWTFPVQIDFPPSDVFNNAGEAQRICARIEEVLSEELNLDASAVICMQPIEGTHRHTTTTPEAA